MKRIVVAIIILFSIIGFYISSNVYINKICKTAIDGIEKCIVEYEAHGTAKADSAWLKNYWAEKEKMLSFFVNHDLIDKVELAVENVAVQSKFKENYIFYDACNSAKILLHQIIEDTKISAHSVF